MHIECYLPCTYNPKALKIPRQKLKNAEDSWSFLLLITTTWKTHWNSLLFILYENYQWFRTKQDWLDCLFVSLTHIGTIFSPLKNQQVNQVTHPQASFGINMSMKINMNTGGEIFGSNHCVSFFQMCKTYISNWINLDFASTSLKQLFKSEAKSAAISKGQ